MATTKLLESDLIAELQAGTSLADIAKKYGLADTRNLQRRKAKLKESGLLDATKYPLPQGHQLKGVTYKANDKGELEPYWVKSGVAPLEDNKEALDELLEAFKAELPRYDPINRKSELVKEDSLVVFPLGDPHIGMMAWDEECGDNWDLKIAEEVFTKVFQEVINDTPACAHALIINLGDYFHYDNIDGMTSRSKNVLDRDGRTAKMFRIGILIARFMIERSLEKHEHTTWMNINGNHDDVLSIALGEALRVCYENNPRITIIAGYKPIQYFQWGKTMIASHHGHTIKMNKIGAVIAADQPKMWGDTEFRYCLMGHIHKDSGDTYPGIIVESFSTLAAPDSFAAWHGYGNGVRNQKAIIYTKEGGEDRRFIKNI
jgi:hypothetical protein